MCIEQSRLERKLRNLRQAQKQEERKLAAMRETQIAQVTAMVRGALFELTVLQKAPDAKRQDEMVLVARRRAEMIVQKLLGD